MGFLCCLSTLHATSRSRQSRDKYELNAYMPNAPINIRPHYPPYGTQVGIIRDLHVNFDPRGGAFDQFAVKKYWSGLGSLRENQKEAEWLPSLEEGKN